MANGRRKPAPKSVFAIMGATGTGKSTFIRLLTNDKTIRIGHNQDSETFEIQTANYVDRATGRQVMLIDTPGFDDSREGITDTDILQKIVEYLEPEEGKSRKLNGIIYMHRISDPRVGGVSRRNLKMFHLLCGEKTLGNVRIVTTNWDRVTEEEGNFREADLMNSAFKPLIDAGAQMRRHANTVESACHIMSELIPFEPVTTAIQKEVRAGMTLAETGAGRMLTEAMRELQKRHAREMADLKEEMETAAKERDQKLRAELELEYKALEEKIKRAESDRAKLARTVEEQREAEQKRREEEKAELERWMAQWADEQRKLAAEVAAARENAMRLENDAVKKQGESERLIAEANRNAAGLAARERATAKAEYNQQEGQWTRERQDILSILAATTENVARLENERQRELERKIADANREAAELAARERAVAKAEHERQAKECQDMLARITFAYTDAAHELVLKNATVREAELERQIADANRKLDHLSSRKRGPCVIC